MSIERMTPDQLRLVDVGEVLTDSKGDCWKVEERLLARPILVVKHTIRGDKLILLIKDGHGAINLDSITDDPRRIVAMAFRAA